MLRVIVAENLIIPSPGALRPSLLALGLFKRKGRVPKGDRRLVRFYHNQPDHIRLPRGLLPAVQKLARCQLEDRRLRLPLIDFAWRGELRPEQVEAIRPVAEAGGGMVVGMPGSGKTNCGLALAATFRQPVLFLVNTKDLARQAMERAKSLFNLPPKAYGYIGEGEFSMGTHFTVAMVQTFVKNPKLAEQIAKKFGCVIIDECHHLPAITIARVVSQFPGMYRVGLTATPDRTDGLGPLARAILGQTIGTIDREKLIAAGRVMIPTVRIVPTGFRHWGPRDWDVVQKARAADPARNHLICSIVADEMRAGRRVALLTELVVHARYLAAILKKRYGTPALVVVGDVPPNQRKRVYDAVAAGQYVLVATKLFNEGVDVPAIDRLVLAASARSPTQTEQQIGRIQRSFHGKSSAVVYDLADLGVESLRDQAVERLQVYRTLGFRVERAPAR